MFFKQRGFFNFPMTHSFIISEPSELQHSKTVSFFTALSAAASLALKAQCFGRLYPEKKPCFVGVEHVSWFIAVNQRLHVIFPGVDGCYVDACSLAVHSTVSYAVPVFETVDPAIRCSKTIDAELVGDLQSLFPQDGAVEVYSSCPGLLKPSEYGLIKMSVL